MKTLSKALLKIVSAPFLFFAVVFYSIALLLQELPLISFLHWPFSILAIMIWVGAAIIEQIFIKALGVGYGRR